MGPGKTRQQLHRQAQAVFQNEPDCPPQRIRAFLRMLDKASEYQTDVLGQAQRLREQVFARAAESHPLVTEPDRLFQHREREVKRAIADELGRPWPQIESEMYADLPAFHRLIRLAGYPTPEELLRHYNVMQAQTLLFWAEEMTVIAGDDFKRFFRHVRFHRLLHEVEAAGPREYRIRLTGPASVLRQTRRYGVHMAALLPALLACRGWRMSARLRLPHGIATFELSPADGLRSHLPPAETFDSEVEQAFAEKFGPHRDGWRLEREGGLLVRDQKVFVPDFVFRHDDGTVAYLEIVGFWTPEYLETKRRTLALFDGVPILVAVPTSTARKAGLSPSMLTYRTRLKIAPVLEQLNALRERGDAVTARPGEGACPEKQSARAGR